MAAIARTRRPRPLRALTIVACMTAIVIASQMLHLGHVSSPSVGALPGAADALAPAVGDLDPGGVSGISGEGAVSGAAAVTADVRRIEADIAFWSGRVAKSPDDFISSNRWGIAEIELARSTGDLTAYLRAKAAFDGTLRRDPTNAAAIGYEGSVLVSLHRFSEAAELASSVLARRPNDPVALATLGDASLELGDVATARSAYTRVNAIARSAASLVRLGHLAFITGDTATARLSAAAAVAESQIEGAEGERAAFNRYQLADVLISTGDLKDAAKAYAAALTADPGSFLAYSGLARVAAVRGDLDAAIANLSAAIAIVPQPEFLARRGDLYALRANRADAKPGDAKRAAADYATVEAISKLAGEAANVYDRTLSLYLANHGLDPERAVRLAQTELVIRKDVYGYDTEAWALLAAGRATEAESAMAQALAAGTRDAKLLYHAGMIANALGQSDRARALLTEALKLDPSFDPLQVARARATLDLLR